MKKQLKNSRQSATLHRVYVGGAVNFVIYSASHDLKTGGVPAALLATTPVPAGSRDRGLSALHIIPYSPLTQKLLEEIIFSDTYFTSCRKIVIRMH